MTDDLMPPGTVTIASLSRARRIKRRHTAVVSFENPEQSHNKRLQFHRQPTPDHIRLVFDDLDSPGDGVAPTRSDVEAVIEFGRRHVGGSLLIHCNAGVARSTAAGFVLLADRMGEGREKEALAETLRLRPCAVPNHMIVAFGDAILGRSGAMVAAVAELDAGSAWCRWRREANLRAMRGERPLMLPAGVKAPEDEDVSAMVEGLRFR